MWETLKLLWKSLWTSAKAEKEKNIKLVEDIISEKKKWIAEHPERLESEERLREHYAKLVKFDEPYVDEFREINEDYYIELQDWVYSSLSFVSLVNFSKINFEHNTAYEILVNDLARRYYNNFQQFRVSSRTFCNDLANNASLVDDNLINKKVKRSIREEDESVGSSENESTQNMNEHENTEATNTPASGAMLPVTAITSLALTTAFTASNIKVLYDEKQGNSTLGTAVKTSVQIGVPSVVGSVPVVIAGVTGATAALPVTVAIAATSAAVASICGGITLGVTLYYNKFFVAQKLRHLEESFKKIPRSELTLPQKKSVIGLINNCLSMLKGDAAQGIEKSSKKIKKLNPQILFNLSKIKEILSERAASTTQSKEAQKRSKKINQYIYDILEHSVLFSLLMNDMKHIKKTYELLNMLKKEEQANKNPDIQSLLAKINFNNLHKLSQYDDLLEQFKREQDYAASTKGKLRAASKAIISFVPEKKEFVQLHEEVIHLASKINDDYQELKGIIHQLQKHSNQFKSEESKQQILDIYTAYKPLSYRETIEKNRASLIKTAELETRDSDDFKNMNEPIRLLRA